jgi:hypothetical protein
MDKLQK